MPEVTYLESDYSFTERIETSRDIVTVFIIQLLEYDKVVSIMKVLYGFNYTERDLNAKNFANEVQAFLLAFDSFCGEHVGIESKDMIQAWYGYDDRFIKKVEKLKQFINSYQIEQDNELKEVWLEKVFLKAWEARVKV